jgi:hypothetical protein
MSALSNSMQQATVHAGHAAEQRLAELGVARYRLDAAVDAGDTASRQADMFSPPTAAGTYRWMSTVHMLRSGLAADDWILNDDRNSPRIISEDGSTAILACRGTAETGKPDGHPRTAKPRGSATTRAVQINGQLEFDMIAAVLADMAAEKSASIKTWFLLYYPAKNGEVRAELSLPVDFTDNRYVDAWSERIMLPARHFGAEGIAPLDAGGIDDVDFVVEAR